MWKKLLTVSLVFALSLLLLIVLSLYSFQRFNAYISYADAVDHNHHHLVQLNKLRSELIELATNHHAFLLFDDSTFYQGYHSKIALIKETLAALYTISKDDHEQLHRLQKINMSVKSYIDQLQSGMIMGYPPNDHQQGSKHLVRCQSLIDDMEIHETNLLRDRYESKEFYENNTPRNFRVVFIFALTIFTVSFGILLKQYRDRLKYQQILEKNIIELNQANSEWEQLTYVATHDFQEPLRKIRTFIGLLQSRQDHPLDEEAQVLINKIATSSERAQYLMQDVVNYSTVVTTREEIQDVDLQETIDTLMTEFRDVFIKQKITLKFESLPVIAAYPSQMVLLFRCLLENSLKFAKENEPCKIIISHEMISKQQLTSDQALSYSDYHKITFQDNGIGFENHFSDRIFKIFQRLHTQNSPYEGRGIGLAIVKRIMTNHLGFVVAESELGKGAVFTLFFPVRK